jgi:hypothetical protein
MDVRFARIVERLHPSLERLVSMAPAGKGKLPKELPQQGVYLFSEGDRHLYVGRSKNLRRRYAHHCNPGSQQNQAVLAFRLAREMTGKIKPAYLAGEDSRVGLSTEPLFVAAFVEAKARIRRMDYRCVEETDPTRQALLELYIAIVLECPYNDFNTS